MKQKKVLSLLLALSMTCTALTGCGNSKSSTAESGQTEVSSEAGDETEAQEETDAESPDQEDVSAKEEGGSDETSEDQEAARQLLIDLTGTYQELWPVLLAEEYDQVWLDHCTELVGEENAEAAFEMLASMVTADIYGEEAVEAYKDGGMAYFCGFTQELSTLEFDGAASSIKGYAQDGSELFSHTYHYIGMEDVRGLYEFESDDADSGEFTYFFLAPDTSDTTWHIEFRYGSDAEALGTYDAGEYAYWLASGIEISYDQAMAENAIELFCTENLTE